MISKFALKPAAISLMCLSTAAIAGTAVYGYGTTRAAAADDADRNARQQSMSRFDRPDCYTPTTPQRCSKSDGEWICKAYVDNHRGSCGH